MGQNSFTLLMKKSLLRELQTLLQVLAVLVNIKEEQWQLEEVQEAEVELEEEEEAQADLKVQPLHLQVLTLFPVEDLETAVSVLMVDMVHQALEDLVDPP